MKLSKVPEALKKALSNKVKQPVYIGEAPSLADECIAVRMLDGNPNATYFGMKSSLYQPLYQFYIRTKDYESGAISAQTIKDLLDGFSKGGLKSLNLVGSILYLGRSEQKMHEFQLTFSAILKEE